MGSRHSNWLTDFSSTRLHAAGLLAVPKDIEERDMSELRKLGLQFAKVRRARDQQILCTAGQQGGAKELSDASCRLPTGT